ncbi:MAG: hypothetical protein IT251_00860 [Chitinophagaceae bacterium]|nr:hypothetical protein [Chitinophagaceae bacterium]
MYIQSMHPNTTTGNSYLHIVACKIEELTIKVLDLQGMIAKKITLPVQAGNQQLKINLNDLTGGNYVLNAFNGDVFVKSIPFIKL